MTTSVIASEYLPNTKWLNGFRKKLLEWYSHNARELAWRGTRDPYKIWVSEIMLQQTTTAAVDGYYRRFVDRFPNVQTLAQADVAEVLRHWEGLGYYRRANQLHKAAQVIETEHNGVFPNTFDAVLALPGIGRYTAGAILSIAYHQRLPILEANTIRLHARLLGYPDDPTKSTGNKLLWQMAEMVLPDYSEKTKNTKIGIYTQTGTFNQALMDLGSLICFPKKPDCVYCPVVKFCKAAQHGLQHVIPQLNKTKNFEERVEAAVVVKNKGRFLMIRYPQGARWAGLWDFPRAVVLSDAPLKDNSEYCDQITKLAGCKITVADQLTKIRHAVTRFKITLCVHDAVYLGRAASAEYEVAWVTKDELAHLALNTTGRKITKLL